MIQVSFKNDIPTLYIVPTPIGNLSEMSPRQIDTLNAVDVIACEDTRTFGKLREYFGIKTPLTSYHMHNEKESTQHILSLLEEGKNVAIVSDAGYPLISDPGQTLVFEVSNRGYNVVPISGSSAFINALVASGLVVQPFAFMGFLESKESAVRKQLQKNKDLPMTTIYYVSVHKLEKILDIMEEELGNRKICLAKELTKQFETFIRGTISEVRNEIENFKGEYVLVVEEDKQETVLEEEDILKYIQTLKDNEDLSTTKAISRAAKDLNLAKNELYDLYHKKEK